MWKWFNLCMLLSLCREVAPSCNGPISQAEYSSLESLFNATAGLDWKWRSHLLDNSSEWTFPSPLSAPCSQNWQGLNCSVVNEANDQLCTITALELPHYNLFGTLPTEFFHLSNITVLSLLGNLIYGPIPNLITSLNQLHRIDLSINSFTGPIPSGLGSLTLLEALQLSDNKLWGTVPSALGMLSNLKFLQIYSNSFTSTLPSEIVQLCTLDTISIYENYLSGELPSEISLIPALRYFSISSNLFTGRFPFNWTSDEIYLNSFGSNFFTGTLPQGVLQSSQLMQIEFENAYFTGELPRNLTQMTSLLDFLAGINYFTGVIPTELYSLTRLRHIYLQNNELTGTLSPLVGSLVDLVAFDVNFNSLSGTIPTEFGLCLELSTLSVSSNRDMYGYLPSELALSPKLTGLYLNSNHFSGPFPLHLNSSEYYATLQFLVIDENFFTGALPHNLGQLKMMEYLSLFTNHFTGQLPLSVVNMTSLEMISFATNWFTGTLPTQLSQCPSLDELMADQNFFTGTIPAAYDMLSSIHILSMPSNLLTGTLPSYPSLTQLTRWNVSSNFLVGDVSNYFSNHLPALNILDISANQFTGSVPCDFLASGSLQALILFENCFSGSLSPSLCQNTALSSVVMDGLTSSSTCEASIPALLQPLIQGQFPKHYLQGSIPSCLWGLSNLTTLHLSGNGLTGELPELSSESQLSDLVLADNNLRGTIPLSFQTRGQFVQLDVSSNRISGVLDKKFNVSSANINLNLTINRLSGDIPAAMMTAQNVNFLTGNLFECQRTNMPQNDPGSDQYVCGSDDLNVSLLAWLVVGVLSVLSAALLWYYYKTTKHEDEKSMAAAGLKAALTSSSSSSIPQNTSSRASQTALEMEGAAKSNRGNNDSWFVSPYRGLRLDLSSDAPRCDRFLRQMQTMLHAFYVLLLSYVAVCLSAYLSLKLAPRLTSFSTHQFQYLWVASSAYLHGLAPAFLVLFFLGISVIYVSARLESTFFQSSDSSDDNKSAKRNPHETDFLGICSCSCSSISIFHSVLPWVIQILNMTVTIVVNGVYVYLLLQGIQGRRLFALQLAMGLYKVAWNSLIMPMTFNRISFLPSPSRLFHRVFVAVFTFVAGPLIATFLSASECFRGAILGESSVRFTFPTDQSLCSVTCIESNCEFNCQYLTIVGSNVFTPAWSYSYQCSSALLSDYIPVLVLSFTVTCVIAPLAVFIIFISDLTSWSVMARLLPTTAMKKLRKMVLKIREDSSASSFTPTTVLPAAQASSTGLFDVISVHVKFMLCLAVLLTFGLASPLLAVVVVLDAVSSQLMWIVLISQYLKLNSSFRAEACRALDLTCHQSGRGLKRCLVMVVVFSSLFWTLSVFDMVGDLYGAKMGAWGVLVCGVGVPLLILPFNMSKCSTSVASSSSRTVEGDIKTQDFIVSNAIFRPHEQNDEF